MTVFADFLWGSELASIMPGMKEMPFQSLRISIGSAAMVSFSDKLFHLQILDAAEQYGDTIALVCPLLLVLFMLSTYFTDSTVRWLCEKRSLV